VPAETHAATSWAACEIIDEEAHAGTAPCSLTTRRADIATQRKAADVLNLGQDDLPLQVDGRSVRPGTPFDRPLHT